MQLHQLDNKSNHQMPINLIHQLNNTQQTHQSKAVLDKLRGSGLTLPC